MVMVVGAALCAESSLAQFNLAGSWTQRVHEDQVERGPGPRIGDYTGLPINDAARLRADTWSPDQWTVPEQAPRTWMGPYPCSARVEIDRPRGFVPRDVKRTVVGTRVAQHGAPDFFNGEADRTE